MPLCKRCWLPLLLCQRLDYVQHYPPPSHTPDSPIKDFLSPLLLSKIIGFMTVDFVKVLRQF